MAINQFVNVTLDPSVAVHKDRANLHNVAAAASAGGGDFSTSWDSAVINTMTKWDAAAASARRIAVSSLPP